MLFQNYGLFWHVDRVKWGKPGAAGTLLGYRTNSEGEIDFRNQRGVYVLYDDNFELLYVGQAGYGYKRLYDRLHTHRYDHLGERWSRFSWFGIDPVQGRKGARELIEQGDLKPPSINDILNHMEAILIASAEPRLNLQSGRFGDAEYYYQWYYEEEDPRGRLARVEKKLDRLLAELGRS